VPNGQSYTYVAAVEPVGDPDATAAVCGLDGCKDPALIILDDRQYWRFQHRDERVFGVHNRADAAIRVSDAVVREKTDIVRPEEYGPNDYDKWPKYPKPDSAADTDW
jgi:hypothetical protein